ncbi:phage portal protein [Candidatus Binatia bacterium]|nr:phage portal protein [Candidatus Binatia bacterium]
MHLIASNLAKAPLEVYRGKTKLEKHPLVDLLKRPNKAMPRQRFIHTIATHALLNPNGYVYIETRHGDDPRKGQPVNLIPLPPTRVRAIRPSTNLYDLVGWRFTGAQAVDLIPDVVARIEVAPDPDDPYAGLPPLTAARLAVETDIYAGELNKAIIKNDGRPAGILRVTGDEDLTDEEVEEIRARWKEAHGNPNLAGDVAVLMGRIEWQQTTIPLRDMQFIAGRKWNLGETARAFNVPPVFLGEYEASGLADAGMRFYWRMLYQTVIQPFSEHIQGVLTESLCPRYEDDLSIVFNWDNVEALRDDMVAKIEMAKGLKELGYTPNEIAEICDLPPQDQPRGDVAWVPAGMVPAEIAIEQAELPDDPLPTGPGGLTPLPPAPGEEPELVLEPIPDAPVKISRAKMTRARIWQRHLKVTNPFEKRVLSRLRGNLQKQRARVLDAMETKAKGLPLGLSIAGPAELARALDPDCPVSDTAGEPLTLGARLYRAAQVAIREAKRGEHRLETMARELMNVRVMLRDHGPGAVLRELDALRRLVVMARAADDAADEFDADAYARSIELLLRQAFRAGGTDAGEQLLDLSIINDNAVKEYAKELPKLAETYFDHRLGELVQIGERVKERLRDTILEGLSLGDTLDQLMDRVRDTFDASASRARTVARTESHTAVNSGKFETYKTQNAQGENEWVTAKDAHVRRSHQIDGERRRTGEKFPNGCRYPGDRAAPAREVCNCFLPGTQISGAIVAALRASYSGPAVEIVTRNGHRLCVTAQHPVLGAEGPVAAARLRVGDHLLAYGTNIDVASANEEDGCASVEDVFDAMGGHESVLQASAVDFHGDGRFVEQKVDVRSRYHRLLRDDETLVANERGELVLVTADSPRGGAVGGGDLTTPLLDVHGAPLRALRVGPAALLDARLPQPERDDVSRNSERVRERLDALAGGESPNDLGVIEVSTTDTGLDAGSGQLSPECRAAYASFASELRDRSSGAVALDEVVEVRHFHFSGHVYDLQSTTGYVAAGGIISKQCRCTIIPVSAIDYQLEAA